MKEKKCRITITIDPILNKIINEIIYNKSKYIEGLINADLSKKLKL